MSVQLARAARRRWLEAQVANMTEAEITTVVDFLCEKAIDSAGRGTQIVHVSLVMSIAEVLGIERSASREMALDQFAPWRIVGELRKLGYVIENAWKRDFDFEFEMKGWDN